MKTLSELLKPERLNTKPTEDAERANQNQHQEAFADRLKGQTIKSANIKHTANGGAEITLDLISTKSPCVIKVDSSGKITFRFKGALYTIKK